MTKPTYNATASALGWTHEDAVPTIPRFSLWRERR